MLLPGTFPNADRFSKMFNRQTHS